MWVGVAVVGLACVGVLLMSLTDSALGLLDGASDDAGSYFAVFALVFGDAVFAIFPGETTLNTASVLASDDALELRLVIIAGFLGAWLGDNALYWVVRSVPGFHSRVEKAQEDERFKKMVELVNQSSFVLVVICRFLPFVRWAVVAGMGALPMPYGRFFLASTIGAIAWSTYTCLMAYFIGTALSDFPIASVAMACASSAILLGIGWVIWRRVRHVKTQGEELAPG